MFQTRLKSFAAIPALLACWILLHAGFALGQQSQREYIYLDGKLVAVETGAVTPLRLNAASPTSNPTQSTLSGPIAPADTLANQIETTKASPSNDRSNCDGTASLACSAIAMPDSQNIITVPVSERLANFGAEAISVSFNKTPSQYKPYAAALGQRLLQPGKERITAEGYLAYAENLDNLEPVEILSQYPLKVRLTSEDSSQSFDLANASTKAPGNRRLAETIEVLLEDSVEGLLSLRATIGMTRHLGSGFKLPNAGEKSPGIDIVQTTYPDLFRDGQPVTKTYWFDSRTKLLGLVGYQSASGDQVDIVIDDWRDIDGEKVPFLIERRENGKLIMRLTLSSAAVTAGSEDGAFGGN
jgi:hypothetical protein